MKRLHYYFLSNDCVQVSPSVNDPVFLFTIYCHLSCIFNNILYVHFTFVFTCWGRVVMHSCCYWFQKVYDVKMSEKQLDTSRLLFLSFFLSEGLIPELFCTFTVHWCNELHLKYFTRHFFTQVVIFMGTFTCTWVAFFCLLHPPLLTCPALWPSWSKCWQIWLRWGRSCGSGSKPNQSTTRCEQRRQSWSLCWMLTWRLLQRPGSPATAWYKWTLHAANWL